MSSALDGDSEPTLVPGTRTGLAARLDLAAIGDVAAELAGVLVVNAVDLVDAEGADFAAAAAATTATAAGASRTLWALAGRAFFGTLLGPAGGRRGRRGFRLWRRRRSALLAFAYL
jgi:hypothetical protein